MTETSLVYACEGVVVQVGLFAVQHPSCPSLALGFGFSD